MTEIRHVTDETFEEIVLKSERPTVVDFWAVWCGPCKMVAPEMEKLAAKYDGKVDVVKVDVDANPRLSQAFNIMSIPTIAYFKPGSTPRASSASARSSSSKCSSASPNSRPVPPRARRPLPRPSPPTDPLLFSRHVRPRLTPGSFNSARYVTGRHVLPTNERGPICGVSHRHHSGTDERELISRMQSAAA